MIQFTFWQTNLPVIWILRIVNNYFNFSESFKKNSTKPFSS